MTYTERRIAKKILENPEYRAAYQEEEELLAKELENRQKLMSMVIAMRKAQNLSQHQLAEKMNISQARVSQMERGHEPFSVDSLLQMIEVLHGSIVILTPEDVKNYGLQEKLVTNGDVVIRRKNLPADEKIARRKKSA
jgi:transcriptional regulator with XRE-family HTH domain